MERESIEVADIFRLFGDQYCNHYRLSPEQSKVMNLIKICRTSVLGGHIQQCDHCGYEKPAYNSCRNRHCPKCQSAAKQKWLNARSAELLPCGYFHLHCLVPAGALQSEKPRWTASRKKYLFNAKSLAKAFRRRYMKKLCALYGTDQLKFTGRTAEISGAQDFGKLVAELKRKDWIVYAKRPFAGPQQVIDYFGRYTHRVAISNYRIVALENDRVTFTYRDRADEDKIKHMTLTAVEFIRRFLLHVLPDGFVKIRYFGFMAHRNRKKSIALIRQLIGPGGEAVEIRQETVAEMMLRTTGIDITLCPRCGKGRLQRSLLVLTKARDPTQEAQQVEALTSRYRK